MKRKQKQNRKEVKMKTTQSKWETKVHKDNVSIVIKDGVSHGAGDGIWYQDKPIAEISDSTYDPEQALTNANLIASAPEMLETLKWIGESEVSILPNQDYKQAVNEWIAKAGKMAREAIARAEGK